MRQREREHHRKRKVIYVRPLRPFYACSSYRRLCGSLHLESLVSSIVMDDVDIVSFPSFTQKHSFNGSACSPSDSPPLAWIPSRFASAFGFERILISKEWVHSCWMLLQEADLSAKEKVLYFWSVVHVQRSNWEKTVYSKLIANSVGDLMFVGSSQGTS